MESFVAMGKLTFRTRCMEIERAARFARCLNANATRFTDIEIRESKRAQGNTRWYVAFLPANPQREAAMLDRQQSAREKRAHEQSFTVVQDPDHDYLHVYSHGTQETYEVSIAGATCSCMDFTTRLRGTGVLCKHLIAAAEAVRRGEVGGFQTVPAGVQRQADSQRFDELFADPNDEWLR